MYSCRAIYWLGAYYKPFAILFPFTFAPDTDIGMQAKRLTFTTRCLLFWFSAFCSGSLAYAQGSLSMASGAVHKGGTGSLNLTLTGSPSSLAAFQWTLSYPPAD